MYHLIESIFLILFLQYSTIAIILWIGEFETKKQVRLQLIPFFWLVSFFTGLVRMVIREYKSLDS